MTDAASRPKPLKGEASRIFKLCLEKDRKIALQGLELAAALGAPLEGALEGVSVDAEGKLVRSKRFIGNDKTQPMLDALLLQQLGMATPRSPEANVRDALTHLVCKIAVLPDLSAFAGLISAHITLAAAFEGQDTAPLGTMARLQSLTFSTEWVTCKQIRTQPRATFASLRGLYAPNLETLDASCLDIGDIESLASCKRLQRVNLRGNKRLTSIEALAPSASTLEWLDIGDCPAITSLATLRQAKRLRWLDLSGLKGLTSLSDLKDLKQLEGLKLYGCESLTSFDGLPLQAMSDAPLEPGKNPDTWLALNDLKALRSLKGMPPLAPHYRDLLIAGARLMTDLEGLEAGAECIDNLRVAWLGIQDLRQVAALKQLKTLSVSNCPELVDASALEALEHLTWVHITRCPKLEILPSAWKSSVQSLVLTGCEALKPIQALPPGIDRKTIEIDDRKLLPRAKPTKALKSDAGAVWKLLSSRDIPNILSGLELSVALGDNFDGLVEGVTVKDGKLVRSKRFTGTGPAQPYLDLALLGLMCRAKPQDALSNLRTQITELDLVLCSQAPQLEGFTALEALTLHTGDDTTPDLAGFGPMPKLKTLKIARRSINQGRLVSLQGLQAPALKDCDLSCSGLEDLSALAGSPKITRLDLSEKAPFTYLSPWWGHPKDLQPLQACAPSLTELALRGCKQVTSLEVLRGAKKLKSLSLRECSSLASVRALEDCTALETLDLENCAALRSLEGLAQLPLAAPKGYNGTVEFSLDGCHALTSLAHLPAFGETLMSLSLDDTRDLKDLQGLRDLPALKSLRAYNSGLTDLRHIGVMPALTEVNLSRCEALKDATPLGTLRYLQAVNLSSSAVTELPKGWSGPVTTLTLENCEALSDLGTPPASLRELHARGCKQLTAVKGLQSCPQLQVVGLPMSITDASGLKHLAPITINLDFNELGEPAKEGELLEIPKTLIQALNALDRVHLDLKGPSGSWHRKQTIDMTGFAEFKSLESLSFRGFDFRCTIKQMTWLIGLQGLQSVVFAPRGNMSHILDGGVYDSAKKVKALQLRICTEAQIEPPAHLAG
jgi:Leucine-rich repeat (LRR) protein